MSDCPVCEELEQEVHDIAVASQALLDSLGEYVRQSMDMNPEWSLGAKLLEDALWRRRKRTGKIDRPYVERV